MLARPRREAAGLRLSRAERGAILMMSGGGLMFPAAAAFGDRNAHACGVGFPLQMFFGGGSGRWRKSKTKKQKRI